MDTKEGDGHQETWRRTLSHKFETEPEKYLEEKLLSALMEQLLVGFVSFVRLFLLLHTFPLSQVGVAEEMQPAVQEHSERIVAEVSEQFSSSRKLFKQSPT